MNKKTTIAGAAKANLSVNTELAQKAQSRQKAGQYKEAIELYKTLLKQAKNSEWQQALAQCYLQRAGSLADKGMLKEALVLWENYALNAEPPHQGFDTYIAWLLQTNDLIKAKKCLGQLSAQQLDGQYPELAALLGLLLIAGKAELQDVLPKDAVFIAHLALVQQALSALRNNQANEVEAALQKLPFRSAFRDFRTLLKATLLMPESLEQAQLLLAKIPSASPYCQYSVMLLAASRNGAGFVNALLPLPHAQIKIIETLRPLNKKQVELLEILVKQKERLSDKAKFNLAILYRAMIGDDFARRYCLAALSDYPAGQRDFNKHFAGGGDEFEQWRLRALKCEHEQKFNDAEYYWQKAIDVLKQRGAEDGAFKMALIMRHIAANLGSSQDAVKWLIDSLEYDPDDRDTYLKILRNYENREQQFDTYKEWLDKSLAKYPRDGEVLVMAINVSTRNKAFKKAAQYAQALLKFDPVNTFAKQILFSSHLAHARKSIKSKKFHLVEKEISQAETLTIGKRYQAMAALLRGFLVFVSDDKKHGLSLIAEAAQKLNDGLANAHFRVAMEALLQGLTVATFLKALPPLAKDQLLSGQEMTALMQLILQYHDDSSVTQALLHKAIDRIKAVIKESIKLQNFSEEQLLSLCQDFERIGHFELLRYCVKTAEPLWVGKAVRSPLWLFYKVYAGVSGNAAKCNAMDRFRLEDCLAEANRQNDQRSASKVRKFLDQYYEAKPSGGFDFLSSLLGNNAEEDDNDPFEQLFGHLPDDIFKQLDRKSDELVKKSSPERIFKILADYLPANRQNIFLSALMNPDAYSALLMLKAADDLGIDIGVTVDDILKSCGINENSKPPLFPNFK